MINLLEDIKYFFIITKRNIGLWLSRFKKLDFSQYMIMTICATVLVFLLSFALYFAEKGLVTRRVFFFPDAFTTKLRGEERFVKRENSESLDVKKVIDELLLGPVMPDVLHLFPQGTTLISMILKDRNLYIDFSQELILNSDAVNGDSVNKDAIPLERKMLACINTIRFNFPDMKKIHFFIHGEELSIQIPNKKGEKIPLELVGFSQELLQ